MPIGDGETFTAGEILHWYTTFLSEPGASPADPPEVIFAYQVDAGAWIELEYGEDISVVRDGLGQYHVDIDSTGWASPGETVRVVPEWASRGAPQAIDPPWGIFVEGPSYAPAF